MYDAERRDTMTTNCPKCETPTTWKDDEGWSHCTSCRLVFKHQGQTIITKKETLLKHEYGKHEITHVSQSRLTTRFDKNGHVTGATSEVRGFCMSKMISDADEHAQQVKTFIKKYNGENVVDIPKEQGEIHD